MQAIPTSCCFRMGKWRVASAAAGTPACLQIPQAPKPCGIV